jgi:SAM-dependent methyltransferase
MQQLNWNAIRGLDEAQWNLVRTYLQTQLLSDGKTEATIRALRAELLSLVCAGAAETPRLMGLLSGLAVYCRDNEFVFAESAAETDYVEKLRESRSPTEALMLRCYRAVDPIEFPFGDVKHLLPITDRTSQAVEAMYMENPYPRWKQVKRLAPNDEDADILIAGCGSGREAIGTALRSPRSRVVGIDLSTANLAYGLSKAREIGVSNVRFIHADMHDIEQLKMCFHWISAVGSLHHVEKPLKALSALRAVLRPDGVIKLQLYSTTGRAAILRAVALRSELGIPATPSGIRQLRRILLDLPDDHPAKGATVYADFYSMSGCRDLLFHVKEHNYTVPELFDFIEQSGMRLANFFIPESAKGFTATRESLTSLEKSNPGFAGTMFKFALAE